MGLREEAIKSVYNGVEHPLEKIATYSTDPNNVITANFPGQLLYRTDTNTWYVNCADSTDWIAVGY